MRRAKLSLLPLGVMRHDVPFALTNCKSSAARWHAALKQCVMRPTVITTVATVSILAGIALVIGRKPWFSLLVAVAVLAVTLVATRSVTERLRTNVQTREGASHAANR